VYFFFRKISVSVLLLQRVVYWYSAGTELGVCVCVCVAPTLTFCDDHGAGCKQYRT
jgi:hypothetical protein